MPFTCQAIGEPYLGDGPQCPLGPRPRWWAAAGERRRLPGVQISAEMRRQEMTRKRRGRAAGQRARQAFEDQVLLYIHREIKGIRVGIQVNISWSEGS